MSQAFNGYNEALIKSNNKTNSVGSYLKITIQENLIIAIFIWIVGILKSNGTKIVMDKMLSQQL